MDIGLFCDFKILKFSILTNIFLVLYKLLFSKINSPNGYDSNTPLHSLFGGYVKYLKQNRKIESVMTERILKSSISVMEAFNDVRNNQSFAHDNPILSYDESLLIFNDIANVIRFIERIEAKAQTIAEEKNNDPFGLFEFD